jgi:hypothetical protein
MSFEKLTKRPRDMITPKMPERGKVTKLVLQIPEIGLFLREGAFWHDRLQEEHGDTPYTPLKQQMTEEFTGITGTRLTIAIASVGRAPLFTPTIQRWHAHASSCLAFSRFAREVFDLSAESEGYDAQEAAANMKHTQGRVFGDFYDYQPTISGIHIEIGSGKLEMAGFSETPPRPGGEDWYEGESIYVRAKTPAQVTRQMQTMYNDLTGDPFPDQAFVSLVPRVKTEVWH